LRNIKKISFSFFKDFFKDRMAFFRTLPMTFKEEAFHSLKVEVCLVLAPDANFFLDSRKQGLPCWRCLSISFLFKDISI